jgi:hypothetical protein
VVLHRLERGHRLAELAALVGVVDGQLAQRLERAGLQHDAGEATSPQQLVTVDAGRRGRGRELGQLDVEADQVAGSPAMLRGARSRAGRAGGDDQRPVRSRHEGEHVDARAHARVACR